MKKLSTDHAVLKNSVQNFISHFMAFEFDQNTDGAKKTQVGLRSTK